MESCAITEPAEAILEMQSELLQPCCPFCGGLLVQLSTLSRCIQCHFEFCEGCGWAGADD
jgi:hypothetical protein